MRRSLLLLVGLCLALVATGCGSVQESLASAPGALPTRPRQEADPPRGKAVPVEDPAPDFSVTTFDGETFSLAEQRGTPVVLNFWESW